MRVASIREFRARASKYLSGNELIFVTKHGKVSSLLVPVSKARELPLGLSRKLLTGLGSAISSHLKKTGVSARMVKHDFGSWRNSRRSRPFA